MSQTNPTTQAFWEKAFIAAIGGLCADPELTSPSRASSFALAIADNATALYEQRCGQSTFAAPGDEPHLPMSSAPHVDGDCTTDPETGRCIICGKVAAAIAEGGAL